jgi:Mce-associated membrane protein
MHTDETEIKTEISVNGERPDAPESESAENKPVESEADQKSKERKQLSISVRALVIATVIAVLVGIVAVIAWLYVGAQGRLDAQARQADNNARAEKISLEYAVNAATMNFQDLNAWKVKLVAGTSSELKEKLTKAATSMEQILLPLQWNSTALPLVAKVRSDTGGTYIVDTFVSVHTKTVQAPDALQSTATYSITIDSNKDWQISDVGGIGTAVDGQK